jgi:hypothetical protein
MAADIFKDCARGAHKVLSTVYKTAKMYAMAWNEPKRKFFVSTCGTTVAGDPGMRRRYRNKLDPETGITYSEAWYKSIPNPLMLFWYFRAASAIDEHNQARQGDLALEDIIVTRSWWIRVITTLIGMCIIDAWKAQRYFQEQHKERPLSDFLDELATELVNYAAAPADRLRQQAAPPADSIEEAVEAHVREHELRPLIELPYYQEKKKAAIQKAQARNRRAAAAGEATVRTDNYRCTLRCKVCCGKTRWYCVTCSRDPNHATQPEVYPVHNSTSLDPKRKGCHAKHIITKKREGGL